MTLVTKKDPHLFLFSYEKTENVFTLMCQTTLRYADASDKSSLFRTSFEKIVDITYDSEQNLMQLTILTKSVVFKLYYKLLLGGFLPTKKAESTLLESEVLKVVESRFLGNLDPTLDTIFNVFWAQGKKLQCLVIDRKTNSQRIEEVSLEIDAEIAKKFRLQTDFTLIPSSWCVVVRS